LAEAVRTVGERAAELLTKIGSALDTTAERIEKHDVPKLIKNALLIATSAMSMYLLGVAVASMMPTAQQVFTQLGITLGYLIPIMINVTLASIMIGMVKLILR